jgi:hypothetical protein
MCSQLPGERNVQAVGQKGDEDVCLNPRFFYLRELDVVTPQLGGVAAGLGDLAQQKGVSLPLQVHCQPYPVHVVA